MFMYLPLAGLPTEEHLQGLRRTWPKHRHDATKRGEHLEGVVWCEDPEDVLRWEDPQEVL